MDSDELKEIIRREEARARGAFHFAAEAVLEIVAAASGVPYFVHLLGRYALIEAHATRPGAGGTQQLRVEKSHVEHALAHSAEHMADLEAEYFELTRGSWQREFALKLLAVQPEAHVVLDDIAPLARSQGLPSIRAQVNHFIRAGVLEESHDNTIRFRDPRLRVFARIREPIYSVNRSRVRFVQTVEERPSDTL